jgi:hypothetical protein
MDIANNNALCDKVEINLNVLGALVLCGVGGHVDGADVVVRGARGEAIATRWPLQRHWPRCDTQLLR